MLTHRPQRISLLLQRSLLRAELDSLDRLLRLFVCALFALAAALWNVRGGKHCVNFHNPQNN